MTVKERRLHYWCNLIMSFHDDLPRWRVTRIAEMAWEDGFKVGKRSKPRKKRKTKCKS